MTYTKGPWSAFYKQKYDEWHVSVPIPNCGFKLGLFSDGLPVELGDARKDYAHLIAAAPDLRRGCLDLHAHVAGSTSDGDICAKCGHDIRHEIHLASDETPESVRRAAISKAKGEGV